MKLRSGTSRFIVYLLLLGGSVIFLTPLAWLISIRTPVVGRTMPRPLPFTSTWPKNEANNADPRAASRMQSNAQVHGGETLTNPRPSSA